MLYMKDFISEIEDTLEEQPLSKLIHLWNRVFPEEKISLISAKDYSESVIEELKSMIIDELEMIDKDKLIKIYNRFTGQDITEEDIIEKFDSIDDEDFDE